MPALLYYASIYTIWDNKMHSLSEGILYDNEACFFNSWMSGMDMD